MSNHNFTVMTNEDRAKSALVKEAKKAWAAGNLRQDFQDIQLWKDLASKRGVRLPIYYAAGAEIKFIKRMAKKLEVDIEQFLDSTGFTTLKQMALANPNWPSYALCGLLLEYSEEVNGEEI